MTRVLLVYPRFPETFWGLQRTLKFLGLRATHPPLGLLTVAGMLPSEYDCRLVDLNVKNLRPADLAWADIVLTGGMMIQRPSVEWVIEQCNRTKVPVVVGGPDATSSHEEFKGHTHFVLGEAEHGRFVETLDQMITAREQITLDLSQESPDINSAPLPRYDLIRMNKYLNMAIQLSRGCPFKCEFCDIPELFGKTTRYKSADRVIEELEQLYRRGWRGDIFWVDDNFIGNTRSAKRILPSIIEWQQAHGRPFHFYTQASVNLAADDELLSAMVKANFYSVFLGIETPVEASLRETKKLQNVKYDLLESVRKIQRFGMEVMGGFIIGFDNDPPDIDKHLINFIQDSGIPMALVALLTAIPSSPLYDRLKKETRLIPSDIVRQGEFSFGFSFNFKTALDAEILVNAYRNVLLEIYGNPENYFKRVETFYAHHGKKRTPVPKLSARSFVELSVRAPLMILSSSYGRAYARFLRRVRSKYPRRFRNAIGHGLIGWHFYKLTHDKLAADEFERFVRSSIQGVQEAYNREHREGLKHAAHVCADARTRLKRLPAGIKKEMKLLYRELELTLRGLTTSETA